MTYFILLLFYFPLFFLDSDLILSSCVLQISKIPFLLFFYYRNRSIYRLFLTEYLLYSMAMSVYSTLIKQFNFEYSIWVELEQVAVFLLFYGSYIYQLFIIFYTYCFITNRKLKIIYLYLLPFLTYLFGVIYYAKTGEKIINEILLITAVIYIVIYVGFLLDKKTRYYEKLNLRVEVLLFLAFIFFINSGFEAYLFINELRTDLSLSHGFVGMLGGVGLLTPSKFLDSFFYSTYTIILIVCVLLVLVVFETYSIFVLEHVMLTLIFCITGFYLKKKKYHFKSMIK